MAFKEKNSLSACHPSLTVKILYENSECIKFEDFESFKNIVQHVLGDPLPLDYISTDFNNLNEVCLDVASKRGLTTFVKSLLREGVKPNRVNKTFKSAPIHFATEGGHVDTLEALLAEPTVNPNLQAGQKTALHIAVNRDDRMCASVLLQKGANANILSEGRPALYLAAVKRQRNMVELILQRHGQNLDLDNYMEHNQTTRDMIKQNLPELLFPNKLYARQFGTFHINDLYYYLTINDETNFLENMLNDEEIFSKTVKKLLIIATENNLRMAVIEILNWFKVIDDQRENIEHAACVAVDKNRYTILRELLNVVPKIVNNDYIIKVCMQLEQLERCHISDWVKCMEFMLDQKEVKLNELMDGEFNTPLHYAAKSGYKEAIDLFLNRGCYIGHMNNTPPIAYISMDTLSSYFDRCMQMKSDEQTKESKIEFNYCCLKPYNDSQIQDSDIHKFSELEVFKYIADNSNLKYLLKHPLLSSFLYLKWRSIRFFLIVNFVINTSFYVVLNYYIYCMAINDSSSRQIAEPVKLDNESRDAIDDVANSDYIWLWRSILIFLIIYISREGLQFCCVRTLYMKDWKTNSFQILLIGFTCVLLYDARYEIGIVTLLSTWEFMILISHNCPWPSCITQYHNISTMIFQKIFFNFVRLFIPFVFLIGAFAFIFHKLFKDSEDNNFSNFTFSMIKTIIMLTGEFDIPFAKHDSAWSGGGVVLVIFVFFMAIVFMSMLNGLAISDTTKILSKAELHGLIHRLYQVTYFENIACTIGELPRKYFGNLISDIFLFPQLEDDRVSCKIYDSKSKYLLNKFNLKMDYNIFRRAKQIILNLSKNQFSNNDGITNAKMDYDILKQAKQIILNKNLLSDNDRIMNALSKLQEAMGIE